MTTLQLFVAFLVSFVIAMPVRGDDKVHYRIQLKVSASDTFKSETTSYLTRELRRVGDIDVVEDDPWFVISVVALANSNRNGNPTGYTMSVVVERPVRYRQTRDFYAKKLDETTMKLMDVSFDDTTRILRHFVQVGPTDDLENMCKKIVADIDGSVFEDSRKFSQQMLELLKKNQADPPK